MLSVGPAALADYYSSLFPIIKTRPLEFASKTVILHSNDSHGELTIILPEAEGTEATEAPAA